MSVATASRAAVPAAQPGRPGTATLVRHLLLAAGGRDLGIVPDTGHTQALRTHPADWERRVVAFLDTAMAQPTG